MESIAQKAEGIQAAAHFTEEALTTFLRPLWELFPDKRLQRSVQAMVRGLITTQTPHISKAMSVEKGATAWALSKRGYRLVNTKRVTTWQLTKSLYRLAQQTVCEEGVDRLVVPLILCSSRSPTPGGWKASVGCIRAGRQMSTEGPGSPGDIPPSLRPSSTFRARPQLTPIGFPIKVRPLSVRTEKSIGRCG